MSTELGVLYGNNPLVLPNLRTPLFPVSVVLLPNATSASALSLVTCNSDVEVLLI